MTAEVATPTRAVVVDPWAIDFLLREQRRTGADIWDEIWEGVLHIPPIPGVEHQHLGGSLGFAIDRSFGGSESVTVLPSVAVADPNRPPWDYRVPDLSVLLPGTQAVLTKAWVAGGPDFVVEVLAPGDETREKMPFYSRVGVRELLVAEPETKVVELFRHDGRTLLRVASTPDPAESEVLGLRFETVEREGKPAILVTARDGRTWEIRPIPLGQIE